MHTGSWVHVWYCRTMVLWDTSPVTYIVYYRDVWPWWDGTWTSWHDDAPPWSSHDGHGTRGVPSHGWPTHGHVLLQSLHGGGDGILWWEHCWFVYVHTMWNSELLGGPLLQGLVKEKGVFLALYLYWRGYFYSEPSARMRSEGYSSWFVCLCVDAYCGSTGYKAAC